MSSDTKSGATPPAGPTGQVVRPTFCMINFNGEEVLRDSLAAASAQAHLFGEMLLVDNGSTDGSTALVEREFPSVRVVRLAENGGPGAARNAGFREARSDLILFVDNDVSLAPGCLERLVEAFASEPGAAVAMPAVIYAHDRQRIQYAGAGSHYLGLMTLHQQDQLLENADRSVRRVASVVTCAFLVDRSRLRGEEPFDESFFYQMEDHDFGVRMRARGFAVLAVPAAVVFHGKGTAGMTVRRTGEYAPIRVYCLIRNRWLFLLKNYAGRTLLVLTPMLLVYEAAQLAMALKKGWTGEWARAARWVVAHRRQIAAERRRVQAMRRLPDRELLENGPVPFRDELARGRIERLGRRALDMLATTYWKGAVRLL